MEQVQDQQRAIRLRNNKRRHRERQKEYVADLERRLIESREKGIYATREVQAAARQVRWENGRLRKILQDQGLDNDAINTLIYSDEQISYGSRQSQLGQASRYTAAEHEHEVIIGESIHSESISVLEYNTTRASNNLHPKINKHQSSSLERPPYNTKSCPKSTSSIPACKLLSILADNPSADLTQVPSGPYEKMEGQKPDSMGCVQARELLMRFATTEDRLDDIAVALEKGCVDDGMGTGCRVMNDVLWKTLDRVLG